MSAQLNPKLPVQENAVRPSPPGIANWQLVVVIESFMLLALGPALLTQYGGLGWLGILLGVVLAGVAYTLSVGNRLGYYALVILQVLAFHLPAGRAGDASDHPKPDHRAGFSGLALHHPQRPLARGPAHGHHSEHCGRGLLRGPLRRFVQNPRRNSWNWAYSFL